LRARSDPPILTHLLRTPNSRMTVRVFPLHFVYPSPGSPSLSAFLSGLDCDAPITVHDLLTLCVHLCIPCSSSLERPGPYDALGRRNLPPQRRGCLLRTAAAPLLAVGTWPRLARLPSQRPLAPAAIRYTAHPNFRHLSSSFPPPTLLLPCAVCHSLSSHNPHAPTNRGPLRSAPRWSRAGDNVGHRVV